MTKVISESKNINTLNENMVTFNMQDLMKYVTTQSKRIQTISEQLEFAINEDYSNVNYDRINHLVSIKESNETLKLFLEKSLIDEVDDYFLNRF